MRTILLFLDMLAVEMLALKKKHNQNFPKNNKICCRIIRQAGQSRFLMISSFKSQDLFMSGSMPLTVCMKNSSIDAMLQSTF